MYCLGKSISMLAEADYFIGFGWYLNIIINNKFNGCQIEAQAADKYGIPSYLIKDDTMAEEILSDLKETAGVTIYADGKPIFKQCRGGINE